MHISDENRKRNQETTELKPITHGYLQRLFIRISAVLRPLSLFRFATVLLPQTADAYSLVRYGQKWNDKDDSTIWDKIFEELSAFET